MFNINPSGVFLKRFCHINLWSYENQVNLLSERNLINRMQLLFVKRKIKTLIKRVIKLIQINNCLDYDVIFRNLTKRRDNEWDWLLYCIIIKDVATETSLKFGLPMNEKVNKILNSYLFEIKENPNPTNEILNNKIEIIKLYAQRDLLNISVELLHKTTHF